jgi:hypothetical protein
VKEVTTVKFLQFVPAVTRSNENRNCEKKKNCLFYVVGIYANLRLICSSEYGHTKISQKTAIFYKIPSACFSQYPQIWSLLCRSSPISAADISAALMVSQPTECLTKSVSDGKDFVTRLMKIGHLASKILTAVLESGIDGPSRKEGWCRNKGTKK